MTHRLPRYHRIAQCLRDQILGGRLGSGQRLDNQRQLARDFGVTLMTLRQALEVLERDRLIVRRHGLGTFVTSPSVDYDILQFRSLAGDLSAHGEEVGTEFLGSRFGRADRRTADELGLRGEESVFVLERRRLLGGHPLSAQASYLPAGLGREVAKADLRTTPLRHVLAFKLGVQIATARESVSAVALPGRAARALGCRPGIPAFRSDRLSRTADGAPVVYDRVFIPGDRFRITRDLRYDDQGSPAREPQPTPANPIE